MCFTSLFHSAFHSVLCLGVHPVCDSDSYTENNRLPRSVGAQYATGDQWRNNSRKNEGMEPKEKQYPGMDVTGDRSKVQCCKEQYCIETWSVRPMNQGKLEVVKQEMARVNIDILGIRTKMDCNG